MIIPETFGDRLRRLRLRAGFPTQREFADHLGVTNVTICYWERAWRCPGRARLEQIAGIFGVTLYYLINGCEEPALARLHAAIRRGARRNVLVAMVGAAP